MGRVCAKYAYICALVLFCPIVLSHHLGELASEEKEVNLIGTVAKIDEKSEVPESKLLSLLADLEESPSQRLKRLAGSDDEYSYGDDGADNDADDGIGSDYGDDVDSTEVRGKQQKRKQIMQITTPKTTSVTTPKTTSLIINSTQSIQLLKSPTNQSPKLTHPLLKLAITMGKVFSYTIPPDVFIDPEEGTNLTFSMYNKDMTELSPDSWIQFLPQEREVYGIPLESHLSQWSFIIEARDSGGLSVRDLLNITVEQHESISLINHKFILEFKLNQPYINAIEWQFRVLDGILSLNGETNIESLTVLHANKKEDICEFVWINDTLLKDSMCPMDQIMTILRVMVDESGTPSAAFFDVMWPDLRLVAVKLQSVGLCAPERRNRTNLFTVLEGHLFVHKISMDRLNGTRKVMLTFSDRKRVPPHHWLQYDVNTREIFGVPSLADIKSIGYLLVPQHSKKKEEYYSFDVEVINVPSTEATAEFRIVLSYPFSNLAYNASNKRSFVEKLALLFGHKETSNIRIASISRKPTTVIWYNTSLLTEKCPWQKIEELKLFIYGNKSETKKAPIADKIEQVFGRDMKVKSVSVAPLGLCVEENTTIEFSVPSGYPEVSAESHRDPRQPPPKKDPNRPRWTVFAYSDTATGADTVFTFVLPFIVVLAALVVGILSCLAAYKRQYEVMPIPVSGLFADLCECFLPIAAKWLYILEQKTLFGLFKVLENDVPKKKEV